MFSDRLCELGAAGLVLREVDEGPPLRVSYWLTPAGAALEPALKELGTWEDPLARGQPMPEAAAQVTAAQTVGRTAPQKRIYNRPPGDGPHTRWFHYATFAPCVPG